LQLRPANFDAQEHAASIADAGSANLIHVELIQHAVQVLELPAIGIDAELARQLDRLIIWTRVTPEQSGPVPVRWIVARNRELTDVVKTGIVEANAARDYTVKADVSGLRAGAPYFFGFRAGVAESAIGRTRTLPRGRLDQVKIAVASCASYPHGFFNAYDALAKQEDVDVVVHLGDYIYEYGVSGYGGDTAIALGRIPSPEVECTRLEDYRARHAQYKTHNYVVQIERQTTFESHVVS
jgi:phosphodiesterase/alkaline phosphatase D-like protein